MPSALPLPREQKTANISLDFTSSSKRNFNSNSMICSGSGSAWLLPTPHKQQTKTNKNSALTTLNNNNNINNEFISNSFYNGSNSSWLFPSTTTTSNRKMSRLPSINNSEFILIRTQPNQIKINKDSATSLINSSKKIIKCTWQKRSSPGPGSYEPEKCVNSLVRSIRSVSMSRASRF